MSIFQSHWNTMASKEEDENESSFALEQQQQQQEDELTFHDSVNYGAATGASSSADNKWNKNGYGQGEQGLYSAM